MFAKLGCINSFASGKRKEEQIGVIIHLPSFKKKGSGWHVEFLGNLKLPFPKYNQFLHLLYVYHCMYIYIYTIYFVTTVTIGQKVLGKNEKPNRHANSIACSATSFKFVRKVPNLVHALLMGT